MTGGELLQEICDFLQSMGGVYSQVTPQIVENLAYSLACGQYVYKQDQFFASYWKVDDIDSIRDLIRPKNITTGQTVYIVEAACRTGMKEMIRQLKEMNADARCVYWHRGQRLKQFRLTGGAI